MERDDSNVAFRPNLFRIILLIGGILFFAAGAFHLSTGDLSDTRYGDLNFIAPCIAVVMFVFTIAGSYYAYLLFRSNYLLKINKKGFIDNSSLFSVGFVAWEEVDKLWIDSKKTFICIRVKNKDKLRLRLSGYSRFMAHLNNRFYDTPIYIFLFLLNKEKKKEATSEMLRFWSLYLSSRQK